MALEHLQTGDVTDVSPLEATLAATRARALFKSHLPEVVRLVMRAGETMPRHNVAGDITVQCIEGRVAVDRLGGERSLRTGKPLLSPATCPFAARAGGFVAAADDRADVRAE